MEGHNEISLTVLVRCVKIIKVLNNFWTAKYSLNELWNMYRHDQKTAEYEDDITVILNCIWCCFKANGFASKLKY